MKDAVVSSIILIIIISFLITSSFMIDKYTSELMLFISNMSDNASIESANADKLIELWNKSKAFISLSVTHAELEYVTRCANQILSYCESNNQSEFIASKRALRQALEHISFSGSLSPDTIF